MSCKKTYEGPGLAKLQTIRAPKISTRYVSEMHKKINVLLHRTRLEHICCVLDGVKSQKFHHQANTCPSKSSRSLKSWKRCSD